MHWVQSTACPNETRIFMDESCLSRHDLPTLNNLACTDVPYDLISRCECMKLLHGTNYIELRNPHLFYIVFHASRINFGAPRASFSVLTSSIWGLNRNLMHTSGVARFCNWNMIKTLLIRYFGAQRTCSFHLLRILINILKFWHEATQNNSHWSGKSRLHT